MRVRFLLYFVATLCLACIATHSYALSESELTPLIESQDVAGVKHYGESVLNDLVQLYTKSDTERRTKIAAVFYGLGWKSEAAKAALLKDVDTTQQTLRLQVQWALGRVSNDDEVVQVLPDKMQNDPNPLFHDKAACALAHDQVHLTETQKAKLYEGVIKALSDPKPDVRRIAGLVLQIQTGQNKGYQAHAPIAEREKSIAAWKNWLSEYKQAVAHE